MLKEAFISFGCPAFASPPEAAARTMFSSVKVFIYCAPSNRPSQRGIEKRLKKKVFKGKSPKMDAPSMTRESKRRL